MAVGFSAAQWQRIREDYSAWWDGELARPLVVPLLTPRPSRYAHLSRFMTNWPEDWSADQLVDVVTGLLSSRRFYGDAFPHQFINFGPGVAAAFTGASLRTTPETVWFEPPERHELADITIRLDHDNRWWQRIREWTETLAERIGESVQISFTDIGGNLDILASLRGTESLLTDCLENSKEVSRLLRDITKFWLEIHDALSDIIVPHSRGTCDWAAIWAPGRAYMLQSDFSYMISPDMCKSFVLPDLETCCDHLEHPFYHMDGSGQIPHLDLFCNIEKLRGIQWVPGEGQPPPAKWPGVLGKIREAGKLCQTWGTPQEALDIVKRHGGKGFQLLVYCQEMSEAQVKRFLADIFSA